ncbi:MAG: 2-oxo-4-hydroxy-4-carboxy-5-ureidoimidazoline decarboxylase [Solirubrobacteraceae bacterium]|nr:2-oxo-4-hydroxy-4-carboxy-5-ureidoimidazoline decarboxylase [Solirubrobacteraceae bacterium]
MAPHATGVTAGLDRAAFVARFGSVVEHSPWVAGAAYDAGPFADLAQLHGAFSTALLSAPVEQQLAVLRAHPDLAVAERAAQALTDESAREQAGAGLDRLADEARLSLADALTVYRDRFGFPFIACVRDHGGAGLAELVDARLGSTPEQELAVALAEVSSIVFHRLSDLLAEDPR